MDKIKERLGEPYTWAGILVVISAFTGHQFTAEQISAVSYLGATLFGATLMVTPDEVLKNPVAAWKRRQAAKEEQDEPTIDDIVRRNQD